MADDDAQFDVELLSANLDDELTADERARVEERLAADPAARQLLDELRSVSQAMRGLPHEKLGGDLRDSVLRRAERAMLVAGEAGSVNRAAPVTRQLPFGRSKRAWFWAGAAIAAALMLMFIERDAPKNADLPREVALSKRQAEAPERPLPPLALRALGDESASEIEAADRKAFEEKDFATPKVALGVPVATAPPSQPASGDAAVSESRASREAGERFDSFAHSSEMASRGGGMMGGAGGVSSSGVPHRTERFVEDAAGNEHLVVHVSLTPEAVQNRAFDATLLKNQIEVEAEAASEAEMLADQPAAMEEVDVVVVEAAPAQVYSTLAEINRDTKNYAGIEIQPQAVRLQAGAAKSKLQAVEEDVRRYNRGRVMNRQQVQLTPDNRNYYYVPQQNLMFRQQLAELKAEQQSMADGVSSPTEQGQVAKSATSQPESPPQSLDLDRDKLDAVIAAGQPQQDSQSGRTKYYFGRELLGRSQQSLARRAAQKLAVKADTLQVMFVLQPEQEMSAAVATPAAPLSSDASTATSAPVPATEQAPATELAPAQEEGLKGAE